MTTATPFHKILIANRGEIALRVLRSAKSSGYRTVAVYSTADVDSRHVLEADQAVCIGEALPAQSYLNIPAIIAAARLTGADAVHPGYGFLAENEGFAQACIDAGLVFIGPTPQAIISMGHKAGAKKIMQDAGVPCVPGYQGEDQSDARLFKEAGAIGWPVMIKAVAGGGGRGMRLVTQAADFAGLLRSAQSEAKNAFGDPTVILERAIVAPRHIEIQVFADRHGNAIHLGERDCSVQRRHQKVIEESPSPAVDPALRARMGATAVAAVKAIAYEGAGTLEFLLDRSGQYFFMEMNTRLQVEHPVTEAVTGLDLVALQLQVAAGEPLPLAQEDVRFSGHAIELRLCAEDVSEGFIPQSGTLSLWQPPASLRVEHALENGSVIPPYYDSMIAKLIAHGRTRDEARRRLLAGMQDLVALGIRTNQVFLSRCLAHPVFAADGATTAFIGEHLAELLAGDDAAKQAANAVAAALLLETSPRVTTQRLTRTQAMGQRYRFDGQAQQASVADLGAHRYEVWLSGGAAPERGSERRYVIEIGMVDASHARVLCEGVMQTVAWVREGDRLEFTHGGAPHEAIDTSLAPTARQGGNASDGKLRASMNGRVVSVLAHIGQLVDAGQPVLVIEAMKMEHIHAAPVRGTIQALHVAGGEQVPSGRVLAEIDVEAPGSAINH
jgi:geranyl-CoA carboxylase alpha subunit